MKIAMNSLNLALLIFCILVMIGCNSEDAKTNVVKNTVAKSLSQNDDSSKVCVYWSLCNYPLSTFYKVYNRMPTQEEYYKVLDTLPWQIPFGKEKIKWEPDRTFSSKGVLTALGKGFSGTKTSKVDWNPNSATVDQSCDGSNESFEETYGVTQEVHIAYLRYRFIAELINVGVQQYKWANGKKLPSSIQEVEGMLGLTLKPNTSYADYNLYFEFSDKPTIIYKNANLPSKLTEPLSIDIETFVLNEKNEQVPIISFP